MCEGWGSRGVYNQSTLLLEFLFLKSQMYSAEALEASYMRYLDEIYYVIELSSILK